MNPIATTILEALRDFPPEIATLIMSMLPVTELRGSLPIALVIFKMPLASALFWVLLGNLIPLWFLLVFFERGSHWMINKFSWADDFFQWLFDRTQKKLGDKIEKYGHWGLAIFVAIPLPVTGVWTGALAAFVFGIEKKKAFYSIAVGAVIAAIIVAAITLGASGLVRIILL